MEEDEGKRRIRGDFRKGVERRRGVRWKGVKERRKIRGVEEGEEGSGWKEGCGREEGSGEEERRCWRDDAVCSPSPPPFFSPSVLSCKGGGCWGVAVSDVVIMWQHVMWRWLRCGVKPVL